jgi:hypothetical protein
MKINVQDDAGGLAGCVLGGRKLNEPSLESRRARWSVKEVQVRLASRAATVSLSASAVAEGGELLGEAAAEGRHVCFRRLNPAAPAVASRSRLVQP